MYRGSNEVNRIWSLVSCRARVVFGGIPLFASLLLVGRFALANDTNNCERMNTAEFKSPDAAWVAHLYGKVCDLGISSSAAVIVDLARTGAADAGTSVFSIDMPSDPSLWPRPRWESPKLLIIQLSSNVNVALQMSNFQDIRIQVLFCPVDPAKRNQWLAYRAAYHKWIEDMAAWSQTRKRDPGAAGPEPSQPMPPEGRKPDSSCQP